MPLRIQGTVTIEIPVADVARSVEWYGAVLGFRCTKQGEISAVLAAPEGVELRIHLVGTSDPRRLGFRNSATGVEHSVLAFKTKDLAGCHRALKERGLVVEDLKPGAHGFGFRDPDANQLGMCDV